MLCTFKACLNSLNNPVHIFFVRCRIDLVDTTGPTLISLINVEVGINVEGCKKCKITKCGGGNNIRHLSNEINKRGVLYILVKQWRVDFFLWRVEFFKIGKRGLHVY